ncbi:cobalt-precorrin-6A reductase [Psychromonas sp. psych-6C06]|uniref:precorrin-6A/cobalt-precorrin-6A reductase n=1 Tax=Psychromonas sp. psych-6C06 TaxID=2058089 RepID=UPI000C347106|nr:precorrin-6A/cobalt-precorrin-6A reductase [Psychromonas sp. psych-6C06]PKF60419.1 cobalt-precorrin-6A reductase [Psychromonas sp. psych-6C06]
MKVLVVGGTADGRYLASELFELGFNVIYSIAGQVRKATLPCPVITGGFTQFGGLQSFIIENKITHIVDATDPFAQKMSETIARVGKVLSLCTIRFQQPPWIEKQQEYWITATCWTTLIQELTKYETLFIGVGQISEALLLRLAAQTKLLLLRTAMPVKYTLPENTIWIKALGPYQLENEIELLKKHHVDAVISKNSGGHSTYAKIQAATELGIPIYQFDRPQLTPLRYEFERSSRCIEFLLTLNKSSDAGATFHG